MWRPNQGPWGGGSISYAPETDLGREGDVRPSSKITEVSACAESELHLRLTWLETASARAYVSEQKSRAKIKASWKALTFIPSQGIYQGTVNFAQDALLCAGPLLSTPICFSSENVKVIEKKKKKAANLVLKFYTLISLLPTVYQCEVLRCLSFEGSYTLVLASAVSNSNSLPAFQTIFLKQNVSVEYFQRSMIPHCPHGLYTSEYRTIHSLLYGLMLLTWTFFFK